MRRRSNWVALAGIILLALADPGRVVRGQAIGPGFELERAGRYADAASVYFTTIRSDPTNIPALLGLERTLFVLNRMPELLPLVQTARARQPDSPALRSLELRVYAALNQPDSLEDRKSTRLNSSHVRISYAVFCLKKKKQPDRAL